MNSGSSAEDLGRKLFILQFFRNMTHFPPFKNEHHVKFPSVWSMNGDLTRDISSLCVYMYAVLSFRLCEEQDFSSGRGGLLELINAPTRILALSLNSAFVYILITINSCSLPHNTQQVGTYLPAKPDPRTHVCLCLHIRPHPHEPPYTSLLYFENPP